MSRDTTPYIFVDADPETLVETLTTKYESIAQRTVHPASPEKLFIQWVAATMVLLAEQINFAGNQNIPSKAVGEGLDNLAQIFFAKTRPQATPATTTLRFYVSAGNTGYASTKIRFTLLEDEDNDIVIPQGTRITNSEGTIVFETDTDVTVYAGEETATVTATCTTYGSSGNGIAIGTLTSCLDTIQNLRAVTNTTISSGARDFAILIPAGTRVTTSDSAIVFATDEDVYVPATSNYADVSATCQTAGTVGNGYVAGQLNNCVDLFEYYTSVSNITMSDGASDIATDDEFYDLLLTGQDAYTSAGARGAYEYYARRVSSNIRNVVVNSPEPCVVHIYAVMEDGSPASSEMKAAILAACNDEDIRPLTDQVSCEDVELVTYDINMTYYLSRDSTESAATIQANVEAAVQNFIAWEAATIGRDINPSKLNQLVIEAGAKRTVINSPTFTVLKNGTVEDPSTAQPEDYVPQMASIGTVTLVNGGYEDE